MNIEKKTLPQIYNGVLEKSLRANEGIRGWMNSWQMPSDFSS